MAEENNGKRYNLPDDDYSDFDRLSSQIPDAGQDRYASSKDSFRTKYTDADLHDIIMKAHLTLNGEAVIPGVTRGMPKKSDGPDEKKENITVSVSLGGKNEDKAPGRTIRTDYSRMGGQRLRRTSHTENTKPVAEYTYDGIIKSVSVFPWNSAKSFYMDFYNNARYSMKSEGPPAPHIQFFSYIPQYSQMTLEQWKFYLYFRDLSREGKIHREADASYVMLYIYELINLTGDMPVMQIAKELLSVWMQYRGLHPIIDKYMSEWFADFCLINNIRPQSMPDALIYAAAVKSTIKEFYLDLARGKDVYYEIIRDCLSDHSVKRSKYSGKYENYEELVNKQALASLRRADQLGAGIFGTSSAQTSKITRDAYTGCLVAGPVKRKITVSYLPFMKSTSSISYVAGIVKKSENIVRNQLGIRSRLTVTEDPGFDMDGERPASSVIRPDESYLRYYEPERSPLTIEKAAQVESESWSGTSFLVSGSDVYDEEKKEEAPDNDENCQEPGLSDDEMMYGITGGADEEVHDGPQDVPSGLASLDPVTKEIVIRTFSGENFADVCRSSGVFADTVAEKINTASLEDDDIGDVILESSGTGYIPVTDYSGEVTKILGNVV